MLLSRLTQNTWSRTRLSNQKAWPRPAPQPSRSLNARCTLQIGSQGREDAHRASERAAFFGSRSAQLRVADRTDGHGATQRHEATLPKVLTPKWPFDLYSVTEQSEEAFYFTDDLHTAPRGTDTWNPKTNTRTIHALLRPHPKKNNMETKWALLCSQQNIWSWQHPCKTLTNSPDVTTRHFTAGR